MTLGATMLLYLLPGVGAAAAVGGGPWRALGALLFWPLFLPWLFARPDNSTLPPPAAEDDLALAIARADEELQAALDSLDGWAGPGLLREKGRVEELRAAWRSQANRIREMDRLLARPDTGPLGNETAAGERSWQLEHARQANRDRLRELRRQEHDDLLSSLAWVRELASMIHLARFRGEPVARAEELVRRLAAAVEDFSGRRSPV